MLATLIWKTLGRCCSSKEALWPGLELRAEQDLARSQRPQVLGRFLLARQGRDLVTEAAQHVDGEAADAAGRPRHDDGLAARFEAVVLEPRDGEARREARGAQQHRLVGVEAVGNRNDPVALDPDVLGVTAVVVFAQATARHQDRVAGRITIVVRADDLAGDVDAADERKAPQDLAGAGRGQRVLVVHAAVTAADDDVTLGQVVDG